MTEEENLYHAIAQKLKTAEQSRLFGKPSNNINERAFVCFFENEMDFKLAGDVHKTAASLDGAKLFDPSGKKRPMKEWVQVPSTYKSKWAEFSKEALTYVAEK